MSVIFTLSEAQWQDLIRRMYGEGVLEAAVYRGYGDGAPAGGCVGVAGSMQDMTLFLTHVAELTLDGQGHGPTVALERVRYLIDAVMEQQGIWWVPCVRVEGGN